MMRSKLFVPAIRVELFEKALGSGADAICFDLEDAVAPDARPEARAHLEAFLANRTAGSPLLLVRTNSVASSDFRLDVASAVWPSTFAIALPKVECAEDVWLAEKSIAARELDRAITSPLGILPTIESPRGLRLAGEIARASARVIGLQIGFADLLEPLGIARDNAFARDQIRLLLRLAAAEADLDCYDSAFPDFRNLAAYQQQLDAARALGFAGGSCIHPAQVEPANLAFTPTSEALADARQIVAAAKLAAQRGDAVTSVNGQMIDRPFVLAAERLLRRNSS
jgi:citrate lyase subunit beta/citryl-CoA lyase